MVEDDLPLFFDVQLDPNANSMAAFTARDPTDHKGFTTPWNRILVDPTTINRTIVCGGQVVGSIASYEVMNSSTSRPTAWLVRPAASVWNRAPHRR